MPEKLAFWMSAAAYTSAIMLTEIFLVPPPLTFSEVLSFLAWVWKALETILFTEYSASLSFVPDAEDALVLAQIASWAVAISCCYYQRQRMARRSRTRALILTLALTPALVVFYSIIVEFVGLGFFEDLFDASSFL